MKKIIFLFAFALLGTMAFASNVNPVKKETGKVGKVEEKSTLKKSNVDESYTCCQGATVDGITYVTCSQSNESYEAACGKAACAVLQDINSAGR